MKVYREQGLTQEQIKTAIKENPRTKTRAMRSPDLWLRVQTDDDSIRKVIVELPPPIAAAALLTIHSKAPISVPKIRVPLQQVPNTFRKLVDCGPMTNQGNIFTVPGYDKELAMMGPAAATLQASHNDASDSASLSNTQNGSMEEVDITAMLAKLGNDKRFRTSYPAALAEANTRDYKIDNLPGATRQVRSINVAYNVQTRTPNLIPKIRDISHRWNKGYWKGLLPKNYFDLLPSRGYKHSTVRVTLESPTDIMGPGNMPVFPANLRKYEYEDIRKNLIDAQVTLSKWATGRNEVGAKIKSTWDKIFHG